VEAFGRANISAPSLVRVSTCFVTVSRPRCQESESGAAAFTDVGGVLTIYEVADLRGASGGMALIGNRSDYELQRAAAEAGADYYRSAHRWHERHESATRRKRSTATGFVTDSVLTSWCSWKVPASLVVGNPTPRRPVVDDADDHPCPMTLNVIRGFSWRVIERGTYSLAGVSDITEAAVGPAECRTSGQARGTAIWQSPLRCDACRTIRTLSKGSAEADLKQVDSWRETRLLVGFGRSSLQICQLRRQSSVTPDTWLGLGSTATGGANLRRSERDRGSDAHHI
jgi:hypothetical protein